MSLSRSTLLLFLALFLVWGQVLAAPFMPCRHELAALAGQKAEAMSHESAQAGIPSVHAGHLHHHPAEPLAAIAAPAALHEHAGTAGCDTDCRLQCVTAVILALTALAFAAGEATAVTLPAASDPFPPAQPPAAHFRPPRYV